MGIYINKTNTDKILRKIINNMNSANYYGIYSNKCFDADGTNIPIVKPAVFSNLVRQYAQLAKQAKMNWKGVVDLFYKNELLPFAHLSRNPLHFKFLYHGSDQKFESGAIRVSNPYDNSMKNGHADGYGLYLTTDLNTALKYGNYIYVYIWNISHLSLRKLSQSKNTLSKAFYINLFMQLNDDDEFLSNYGDVDYEGLDTVIQYALDDLVDDDVNNINSIINAGGDANIVTKCLIKNGYGYTINPKNKDQIIVYDSELLTPFERILDTHLGNPIQI